MVWQLLQTFTQAGRVQGITGSQIIQVQYSVHLAYFLGTGSSENVGHDDTIVNYLPWAFKQDCLDYAEIR